MFVQLHTTRAGSFAHFLYSALAPVSLVAVTLSRPHPDTTQTILQAFMRIGPIEGLTNDWFLAPDETGIPIGTPVQLVCPVPLNGSVAWVGARETDRIERNGYFESYAECLIDDNGPFSVRCDVIDGDLTLSDESVFTGIDISAEDVRVSDIRLLDSSSWSSGGILPEIEHMLTVYQPFSIAAIEQTDAMTYATSLNRYFGVYADVSPPEMAPLVEWRIDGVPVHLGLSSGIVIRPEFGVGWHDVAAGPLTSEQFLAVFTYDVRVLVACNG